MDVIPLCAISVVVWSFVLDGCLSFVCNIGSSMEFCP